MKQPVLVKSTDKNNKAATPADIDIRDLITSITGSDLYVRSTASASGVETNVTFPITSGMGAVRDLDVSPDGTKVVFSLRLPLDPKLKNTDPKQPNWKIYQYDAKAKTVTQLTNDNVTSGHDVGAHYLPDGRIIFSSTRQIATQAILLDEGRPQYQAVTTDQQQAIFLLHVMNADGSGMHQISFNTNHDFGPSVLASGQIVFSRWDTEGGDQISLYATNPDGIRAAAPIWRQQPRDRRQHRRHQQQRHPVPECATARRRQGARHRPAVHRARSSAATSSTSTSSTMSRSISRAPRAAPPTTPGQTSATSLGVTTDANMPSAGGRFYSMYPLYDGTNRMLVSWAPCLVLTAAGATEVCSNTNTTAAGTTLAPPQYTLWVYDFDAGTLSPHAERRAGNRDRRAGDPAGAHARPHLHPGLQAHHSGRSEIW